MTCTPLVFYFDLFYPLTQHLAVSLEPALTDGDPIAAMLTIILLAQDFLTPH